MGTREFAEEENKKNSSSEYMPLFDKQSEFALLMQTDRELLAQALSYASREQLDSAMYILENQIDSIIQHSLDSDDTSFESFIDNIENSEDSLFNIEKALVRREIIRVMRYQREKDN
jgi:hypothetical protein